MNNNKKIDLILKSLSHYIDFCKSEFYNAENSREERERYFDNMTDCKILYDEIDKLK